MNRVEYFFRVFSQTEPSLQSKHPLQRPTQVYIPGLTDKPWHDSIDFEWTKRLEESYKTIRFFEKNGCRPNLEPPDFFPAYYSAYVGKQVPQACQLRIANETRTLVEGKPLIFDDTFRYEAWNNSEHSRFVLVFEVYYPALTDSEIQQFEEIRNRHPIIKKPLESWFKTIDDAGKESPAENLWNLQLNRENSAL